MLGLCCFTVLTASCLFPLPLDQENYLFSGFSRISDTLNSVFKLAPAVDGFVEILVSHPGFTDLLENTFVEREQSGVTVCSKVF